MIFGIRAKKLGFGREVIIQVRPSDGHIFVLLGSL
jgi:hypothetical protein